MDAKSLAFLGGVLGIDGANALTKAARRAPELENAIVPRAILAWLNTATRLGYEGEIPGVQNTYIQFQKSERPSLYDGSITIGDEVYPFENATLFHLAASVAIAIGADESVDPGLKDGELVRLGKSIDVLAKARLVSSTLSKAETPGKPAGPRQTAPVAPQAPRKQSVIPKPPAAEPKAYTPPAPQDHVDGLPKVKLPGAKVKKRELKVTKSQSERMCPECGQKQFKNDRFRGCVCFRDLQKSTETRLESDEYVLTFGKEWDMESISVLIKTLGVV